MRGTNVNKHGKIEKNQKVKEGDCIFPFKYQWKENNECIDNDEKGKICATSVTDRGTLKTYASPPHLILAVIVEAGAKATHRVPV